MNKINSYLKKWLEDNIANKSFALYQSSTVLEQQMINIAMSDSLIRLFEVSGDVIYYELTALGEIALGITDASESDDALDDSLDSRQHASYGESLIESEQPESDSGYTVAFDAESGKFHILSPQRKSLAAGFEPQIRAFCKLLNTETAALRKQVAVQPESDDSGYTIEIDMPDNNHPERFTSIIKAPDGHEVATKANPHAAKYLCDILNNETEPLRRQVAELKAASTSANTTAAENISDANRLRAREVELLTRIRLALVALDSGAVNLAIDRLNGNIEGYD